MFRRSNIYGSTEQMLELDLSLLLMLGESALYCPEDAAPQRRAAVVGRGGGAFRTTAVTLAANQLEVADAVERCGKTSDPYVTVSML